MADRDACQSGLRRGDPRLVSGTKSSGSGCGGLGCGLFLVAMLIGAVVAAAISLAALVDPFDWMPPVPRIWEDCEGDCELAHRFPGFWWHAVANLVYAALSAVVAYAFAASVADLRDARVARFANAEAAAAFERARGELLAAGTMLGALAALPLIVAIA
jgi:hypothetical protein